MKSVRVGCALLIVAACGQAARAEEGMFGLEVERASGWGCHVTLTVDQAKFIASIPNMKEIGLLNSEFVTQTRINTQPTVLSLGFATMVTPGQIEIAFENDKKAKLCAFVVNLKRTNDYGRDETVEMFHFSISHELYEKIDWNKFEGNKLLKVVPGFTLSPTLMTEILREKEASGDE